jgi:hypothetical protein
MKTIPLPILLALAGAASVVSAQPAQNPDATAHAAEFARADQDGDGFITPDEDRAALTRG